MAIQQKKPEAVKFMCTQVKPKMAALLGLRDRLSSLSRTTTGNRRIERFLKGD